MLIQRWTTYDHYLDVTGTIITILLYIDCAVGFNNRLQKLYNTAISFSLSVLVRIKSTINSGEFKKRTYDTCPRHRDNSVWEKEKMIFTGKLYKVVISWPLKHFPVLIVVKVKKKFNSNLSFVKYKMSNLQEFFHRWIDFFHI